MKKMKIIFLAVISLFLFTKCENSSSDKLCNNAESRGKIISTLMHSDTYMNEVMDSMMQSNHSMQMMAGNHNMMNMMMSDPSTHTMIMDKMMNMSNTDSSMCKMMMGKTMDMCDVDQGKCGMMLGSMQEHPKAMQTMQDMGMCNMKGMNGMKTGQKKGMNTMHQQ